MTEFTDLGWIGTDGENPDYIWAMNWPLIFFFWENGFSGDYWDTSPYLITNNIE